MRTSRPILLASAAVAVLVAAACSRDADAPAGPTIAGVAPSPVAGLFLTSAVPDTTDRDSVIGGYGSNPCGGLDYVGFEYEPETGTEYVVCADSTGATRRMVATGDTTPPPPPAPAPAPTTPR